MADTFPNRTVTPAKAGAPLRLTRISLWQRVWDHRNERFDGFTARYAVKTLVRYEHHHSMEDAIRREKQIKKWNRAWKLQLIEAMNPDWRDLTDDIDVNATLVKPKAGPRFRGGDGERALALGGERRHIDQPKIISLYATLSGNTSLRLAMKAWSASSIP